MAATAVLDLVRSPADVESAGHDGLTLFRRGDAMEGWAARRFKLSRVEIASQLATFHILIPQFL
jgi:hypothetical protein